MKDISLFIQQNYSFFLFAIIILVILIFIFLRLIKNELRSVFSRVNLANRILLMISIAGFLSQILLFKNKTFEYYGSQFALLVNIILSLLFQNREKIDNKEFNDFVIMFLVGQSAYCMVMANQALSIIDSILYASMYIGIPMFMALKFTSREQNTTKNILEKLKLIEEKLDNLDKSIDTPYQPSKSIFSMFKRSK